MESSSDSAELAGELPGWHLYVTQADRSRYDCTTGQFGGYKGQRSTWFTMVKMQIVQVFIHSFIHSHIHLFHKNRVPPSGRAGVAVAHQR